MVTSRPLLALGVAVLAASATVLATGAPAGAAESVQTSSATPSVSNGKLKRVDAIELRAESLVLERDHRTVVDVSMRDARSTVSLLNRLLGTPSRTQTAEGDGGACFPAGTTYTWGGAIRVAALSTPAGLGNAVEIRVLRDEVRSRSGSMVELSGPHGVQVGDDIERRIERTAPEDRMSFGSDDSDAPSAWQVLLQRGWDDTEQRTDDRSSDDRRARARTDDDAASTDDSGRNGVSALTDDTTVTVLGSPMPVNATDGC
ncbi:hypothetical protein NS184_04620 [Curtobacterium luteum]|uniref:G5 domain-containing protein n=1 Tax=Curtobacterium luteum TaxID=33881 RepID=A0A175RZG1_9MICO|nr:hypothetical protein NS184_04620 [Curtobacterium luteum]